MYLLTPVPLKVENEKRVNRNNEGSIHSAFLDVFAFFVAAPEVVFGNFGATWSNFGPRVGAHWILKGSPKRSFFEQSK